MMNLTRPYFRSPSIINLRRNSKLILRLYIKEDFKKLNKSFMKLEVKTIKVGGKLNNFLILFKMTQNLNQNQVIKL